jgi:IS4 transposase
MLTKLIAWFKYLLGIADLNKDGALNEKDVEIAKDTYEVVKDAAEVVAGETRKVNAAIKSVRTGKPK